ncbi:hypothetical protein [Segetibacter aerophilus]|uniref:hypothetical protein n=1 Tax=Segetibacter aerophilus TaxID=670293 RepID=UPI0011BF3474|nr:hypothetical protein [Segetibacter aerophilus]
MNGERRPLAIKFLCITGFIGMGWGLIVLFTPAARHLERWYFIALSISFFVGFVSTVGLWQMRKWGFYLYLTLFLANNILLYSMHMWKASNTVIPLISIFIMAYYLKRMD